MISNDLIKYYKDMFEVFTIKKLNIITIENKLEEKYKNILLSNENTSSTLKYFSLVNDLFFNNISTFEIVLLQDLFNNKNDDSMITFIEDTYKRIISHNVDYIFSKREKSVELENKVGKSDILFLFKYKEDYNTEPKSRLLLTDKLKEEIENIRIEMSNKINNPIKIIYDKVVIPPKNLNFINK